MLDRFGDSVMMTVAILSLLTLAIGISWAVARSRRKPVRPGGEEIPLFTIPVSELVVPIGRPPVDRGAPPRTVVSDVEPLARPRSRQTLDEPEPRSPLRPPMIRTRDGAVSTIARPARQEPTHESAYGDDEAAGEPVDGASVRYWRVADGTLQFLPGRLTISAGRDAGHEIRFVRTSGPDGTCITFGRAEGAPYRHVQLREPTVSRAHARMSLEAGSGGVQPSGHPGGSAGRWRLENLSSTNPVMVNGRALGTHAGPLASVILSDGDRIEMGEVAFVFHAR
jgi:hypothetical protein